MKYLVKWTDQLGETHYAEQEHRESMHRAVRIALGEGGTIDAVWELKDVAVTVATVKTLRIGGTTVCELE